MFLIRKTRRFYLKSHSSILSFHSSAKTPSHKTQWREQKIQTNISSLSPNQLQVIGSGAADQPPAVILRVSNKSYLFNCGEGIKRYCQDSEVNLNKISNVFFTQSKWNCIGGILDLMCTTHECRPPNFHGPNNLQTIFQRMIHLSSLAKTMQKYFISDLFTSNRRYEDDRVVIEPIELQSHGETIVIYLCQTLARRGGFSVEKATDSRIPIELLPKLLRGEDVTLDDGTVIASDDLRQPDLPEFNFIRKCAFAMAKKHHFLYNHLNQVSFAFKFQ